MKRLYRNSVTAVLCTLLVVALPATVAATPPPAVVVFAAASLKNALDDAKSAWERKSGIAVVVDYAGSNVLAKQIEQGAPADIFLSADRDWMQYVSDKALTRKNTERDLLGNRLVLVAPKSSTLSLRIAPGFALAAALGDGRLAMCNLAVPAGKYGAAALQALGVWSEVEKRTAQAENVRTALVLVARGEAPLGIVYATDAKAEPNVRVVDTFPDNTYPPIVYPIALLRRSGNAAAAEFLNFLESPEARPSFEKQGFAWLAP